MIWKQILADIMGLPVLTPINPVEAPLGDAFMAAKAGKESIDFTQISEWIEFNEAVMPDMKKHNAYNEYFKVYKALYENLKDTMSIRANILNDTNLRERFSIQNKKHLGGKSNEQKSIGSTVSICSSNGFNGSKRIRS